MATAKAKFDDYRPSVDRAAVVARSEPLYFFQSEPIRNVSAPAKQEEAAFVEPLNLASLISQLHR